MSDSTDPHLPDDLPDEQQLDEYLRGGSAVSRQYRQLHNADVPVELDRLVLRQAQEAVKARPVKSRPWLRWSGPLALAASMVLVVSIVIESGVHQNEQVLSVPATAPAEPMRESAEEAADARVMNEVARERGAADAEKKAAENSASDMAGTSAVPAESSARAERAKPAPIAPFVIERPAAQPLERPEAQRSVRPAAPSPATAPKAQQAPAALTMEAPAAVAEMPAPVLDRRAVSGTAPQSNAAATSARAQAPDESEHDLSEVAVTSSSVRRQQHGAGPRNTITAPTASFHGTEEEQTDQPRSYSDPELWLRDIRELRKQKKHEEADREWRRFRYSFPNYSVDENDLARGAQR